MLHPKDREMPFWRDGRRVALPAGRLMGRTVRMMHTYPESLTDVERMHSKRQAVRRGIVCGLSLWLNWEGPA